MNIAKYGLVSVIITSKNEQEIIKRVLDSVKNQTYRYLEIILVDNYSKDQTLRIAKTLISKVYQHGPERSAQRNYGVKKARGKYLFFLDADMELSGEVVKQCILNIQDKGIGAIVIPEQSIASKFWETVKAFERSFYNDQEDLITDAARFFRKSVFKKVGGYDEMITGPEDWDITDKVYKNGFRIGRIKARIYHYENIQSLFSLAKKKFYYGLKSHRYLSKQKISPVSPKTIYFLRPVFYKSWKKILFNPKLSVAMFMMLSAELIGGGFGYLVGRISRR